MLGTFFFFLPQEKLLRRSIGNNGPLTIFWGTYKKIDVCVTHWLRAWASELRRQGMRPRSTTFCLSGSPHCFLICEMGKKYHIHHREPSWAPSVKQQLPTCYLGGMGKRGRLKRKGI